MSMRRPTTRSTAYQENAFVPQASRTLTAQERLTRMQARYDSLQHAYDVLMQENARQREDLATMRESSEEAYRRGMEIGHAMAQRALDECQREMDELRRVTGTAEGGIGN